MSWAQHDKTLQETIAFSDKKIKQPKTLNLKKRITFQKRSKKML